MGRKQEEQEEQDKPENKKEESKGGESPQRRIDPELSQIVHFRHVPRERKHSKLKGRKYL